MMNKKELMKETKKALVNMLKEFVPTTKEDKDIITYTLDSLKENSRNVTKSELVETLEGLFANAPLPLENKVKLTEKEAEEEILNILDEEIDEEEVEKEKPIENKKKVVKTTKKKSSKSKKEEPKEEEIEEEIDEEEEVKPKNTTKTKDKSKSNKLATQEVVISFPEVIESNLGTLKIRNDIKDIKKFAEEIENDVPLVMGAYWSKTLLKQFNYDNTGIGVNPESFDNDLDLIDTYYASENVVYGISVYTECQYTFLPDHFTIDKDNGLRYAFGIEYQVYEIVDEE